MRFVGRGRPFTGATLVANRRACDRTRKCFKPMARSLSQISGLSPDLLEALDGWLAIHEFAHRPAECLEIFCGAMCFDRSLISVALHENISVRHFAMIELIQQAALLVFVDLLNELRRDLLEFLPLPSLILIVATTPSIRVTPCFACVGELCETSASIATAQSEPGRIEARIGRRSSILKIIRCGAPEYGWKAGF